MSGAARWPEYRLADRIKGLHARVLDLKTSDKDCTRLAAWMLGRRLTQLGVSAIGLPGGIDVHVVLPAGRRRGATLVARKSLA